jgi:NAD(P)-dependent dehydrogenase (short-subunit alcohol dehydrogenase family)
MAVDLSGGVAVITGAARGIGEGIARSAARRGMKLVLADIAEARLRTLATELTAAGSEVLAVPTDVSDATAIDRLAAAAFDRFGDVHLLVNNAGIEVIGYSWELTVEQWEKALRINALGPIHGVRAFAGRMVAAQQPAFIVNVTSLAALGAMPLTAPYMLTKHAVLSFSESLFLEMQRVAPMIRVSAVLPGPVKTGIFEDALSDDELPAAEKHRQIMADILSSGMDSNDAGTMILDQVIAGKFWVTTHPEMMAQAARRRADYLTTLADPSLPPGSTTLFGD